MTLRVGDLIRGQESGTVLKIIKATKFHKEWQYAAIWWNGYRFGREWYSDILTFNDDILCKHYGFEIIHRTTD